MSLDKLEGVKVGTKILNTLGKSIHKPLQIPWNLLLGDQHALSIRFPFCVGQEFGFLE